MSLRMTSCIINLTENNKKVSFFLQLNLTMKKKYRKILSILVNVPCPCLLLVSICVFCCFGDFVCHSLLLLSIIRLKSPHAHITRTYDFFSLLLFPTETMQNNGARRRETTTMRWKTHKMLFILLLFFQIQRRENIEYKNFRGLIEWESEKESYWKYWDDHCRQ